ncbi:ATP-binding protein [Sutterella megalosphaeroides]|uniref:histidine kinase n=1 Tax=Sutterella megalosphaeroides TaxID=2494234 RepID=A0A2Z6I9E0_9BURK|nr:ATP-binding protein [Sutterella megalosphaeroides]BBF23111.1 hypothetical protein SUTMEG_10020 [Sutterella megalosphaeroides]
MYQSIPTFFGRVFNAVFNLRIFIIVVLLAADGLLYGLLRSSYVDDFQNIGVYELRGYRGEQMNRIAVIHSIAAAGYIQLEKLMGTSPTDEEILDWIRRFLVQAETMLGSKNGLNVSAAVGGRAIAIPELTPWLTSDYNLESREWYIQAKRTEEPIVSNVYQEFKTGRPVITVTRYNRAKDLMFVFDLYPAEVELPSVATEEGARGSFFLTDAEGKTFLKNSSYSTSFQIYADYVPKWLELLRSREKLEDLIIAPGPNSPFVSVYGSPLPVGGWVLHAVPTTELDRELKTLNAVFFGGTLALILAVLWGLVRIAETDRRLKRVSNTVTAMISSSELVATVNVRTGHYELLSGNARVRRMLPEFGNYALLLAHLHRYVLSNLEEFDKHMTLAGLRRLYEEGTHTFGGTFEYEDQRGGRSWMNLALLLDKTLLPDEVLVRMTDATDQHRREAAQTELLKTALEASRRSERSKQLFFHSMSHEMRTHLNAICNMTAIAERALERGTDAANLGKTKNALEHIRHGANLLLKLVNDLLELAAAREGNQTAELRPFLLAPFVEKIAHVFDVAAKKEEKRFLTDFSGLDVAVESDPVRIELVLNNLLSNAVKYTPPGRTIRFTAEHLPREGADVFRFIVRDEGIGMSDEFLKTIFEPYARERRYANREVQGTGLGMPIVKALLQILEGNVRIESVVNKGTTVIVTLPLRILTQEEKRALEAAVGGSSGSVVPAPHLPPAAVAFDAADTAAGTRAIESVMPEAASGNEPEKGATKEPADKNPTDASDVKADEKVTEKATEKTDGSSGEKPKPLCLIVEDNFINQEVLAELLDELGCRSETAENGRAAVERFDASTPGEIDLVLMDINMPEMNGLEAAAAIRARAGTRPDAVSLPIVAVTANVDFEDINAIYEAGMNGHLAKPLDFGKLRDAVVKFTGRREN